MALRSMHNRGESRRADPKTTVPIFGKTNKIRVFSTGKNAVPR